MPKLDLPALKEDAPSHVLVTIPAENLLGMEHPKVIVSGKEYLPGETYMLPLDAAKWVESRIKGYQTAEIKINRNMQDGKSMREAGQYGSAKGGGFVDPHSPAFN